MLGKPAHVVGCRVSLLDIGSFISHPLNPGQHYLHQALYVDLHVESEAMWEDGGITSPSLVNSPNTMMCIGGLVFITICTSWGDNSSSDPGRNFSHLRKDKACLVGWDAWVCSKALHCSLLSCPSWPVIKIDLFSSCMRNSECFHALPAW